ncbi:helix-turn-helix transcriptional regulator, partial [Salinispira pacifica]
PATLPPQMRHLILAVYILLFTGGAAGLAALLFLSYRLRSRLVRYFILLQLLFIAGLLVVMVYYYLGSILVVGGHGSAVPLKMLALISTAVQAALYFTAFQLVRNIRAGGRFRRPLRRLTEIFCAAAALAAVAAGVNGALELIGAGRLYGQSALLSGIEYLLVSAAMALLGLSLLLAPVPGEHTAVRLLVRGWAVALLAFVPLSAVEWGIETYGLLSYGPLSLDFIFYFACSVFSVLAFLRSLRVDRGEPSARVEVGDDLAARFGLTFRERDIVPLIARGLANKEIAAELGISEATVRTHIYNLFQKVDARSRIELLNKLSD